MRPLAVTLTGFLAAMTWMTAAPAAERNPARTRASAAAEQESAQRIIVKFRQSSLSVQATPNGESASATAAAADTARLTALASRTRVTLRGTKGLGGNMHVMQLSPSRSEEHTSELQSH